jgi:hypothetical protein
MPSILPGLDELFAGAEIDFRSKVGPVVLGFKASPFLVTIPKAWSGQQG